MTVKQLVLLLNQYPEDFTIEVLAEAGCVGYTAIKVEVDAKKKQVIITE